MTQRTISLVHFDCWTGLYIDGKLVYEDHSIDVKTFVALLKDTGLWGDIEFSDAWAGEQDRMAVYEAGSAPDSLADLVDTDLKG